MDAEDLANLTDALDRFENKLADRWQRTINDAVRRMAPWTPPPVHYLNNPARSPEVWEHRRPEVQAHINFGCEYLEWFDGGRNGKVQSISCHGMTRNPDNNENLEVWWQDHHETVDEDTIYCGIGELFALAEEWAGKDRDWVSGLFPRWVDQKVAELEQAHHELVQLSADLGGFGKGGTGGYSNELGLSDNVSTLATDEEEMRAWRVEWSGTAADTASKGFFASVKPTMENHARLALSIATMINHRAKIINRYRRNGIDLVEGAVRALGEQAEESTDHTAKWQTVQGVGMVASLAPQTAPAGGVLSLVGWLGELFLAETKEKSFRYHPGDVATDLYEAVLELNEDLDSSEAGFVQESNEYRTALNAVPSTFLELYDLTENDPGGTH